LPHRTALALALTVGSAWLTALAFPESRVWVLAWIGVAPFLAALRLSGVRAAPWLGALWALVFSVVVGAWLADGMAFYFEQPRWLAVSRDAGAVGHAVARALRSGLPRIR
jgi:apolipoprotein N-acyltransferase